MRRKVERIAGLLTNTFKKWDGVVAVVLGEASEQEVMDPYFALVVDVYYKGRVPEAAERKAAFGDPGAFEAAEAQKKDRFFLEELPIRVEYKRKERSTSCWREIRLAMGIQGIRNLYVLSLGSREGPLRSIGWVESVRKQIKDFPDTFWTSFGKPSSPRWSTTFPISEPRPCAKMFSST